MKRILLLACLGLGSIALKAQFKVKDSSGHKPEWISKAPQGKEYKYFIGVGSSSHSLSDAKEIALADIISQLSREKGIEITAAERLSLTKTIGEKYQNGQNQPTRNQELNKESTINIKAREVFLEKLELHENYWQKSALDDEIVYEYFLLARIIKKEKKNREGYGLKPVWRSVLIPGWGQLYKGQKFRSLLYFTTIASSVSYIYYSNVEVNYHIDRLAELNSGSVDVQHLEDLIQDNEDDLDIWKTRRNISIGVAAGVYIWNIIDAATSKGKRQYYAYQPDSKKWQLTAKGAGLSLVIKI